MSNQFILVLMLSIIRINKSIEKSAKFNIIYNKEWKKEVLHES